MDVSANEKNADMTKSTPAVSTMDPTCSFAAATCAPTLANVPLARAANATDVTTAPNTSAATLTATLVSFCVFPCAERSDWCVDPPGAPRTPRLSARARTKSPLTRVIAPRIAASGVDAVEKLARASPHRATPRARVERASRDADNGPAFPPRAAESLRRAFARRATRASMTLARGSASMFARTPGVRPSGVGRARACADDVCGKSPH
jgi:hypothetical protein